jgi:hypothetical protein
MATASGSSGPSARGLSTVADCVARPGQRDAVSAALAKSGVRVLVLYEQGAPGSLALSQARGLIQAQAARLTVVALAPKDTRVRGCGVSALDYNEAVHDSALRELDKARGLLGPLAEQTVFEVVVDDGDTSPVDWVSDGAFDAILLPARRRLFSRREHPLASKLRRSTAAEVRVVGA